MVYGILPVYKLPGMSTYDVIRVFKEKTGFEGKVGHGGTLDVFASGVVYLLLGEATKWFDELLKLPKTYIAGVRLGVNSSTLDVEGSLESDLNPGKLEISDIKANLAKFKGEILQTVPAFSAAKHEGKPLYKLAREGIDIGKNRLITIYSLDIVSYKFPLVTLSVTCSSGTYIRQLTYDMFKSLNQKSFLYFLERAKVGTISVNQCIRIVDFALKWKKHLLDLNQVL